MASIQDSINQAIFAVAGLAHLSAGAQMERKALDVNESIDAYIANENLDRKGRLERKQEWAAEQEAAKKAAEEQGLEWQEEPFAESDLPTEPLSDDEIKLIKQSVREKFGTAKEISKKGPQTIDDVSDVVLAEDSPYAQYFDKRAEMSQTGQNVSVREAIAKEQRDRIAREKADKMMAANQETLKETNKRKPGSKIQWQQRKKLKGGRK